MPIISSINNILWGYPMLFLLLGTHFYFSFKSRFIQRYTFHGIKLSLNNSSAFRSLATMLAATLGTGNIIGVSSAIALGGPGALFWCLITGVFGMATSYAECYLSIHFRKGNNGGPMYVLKNILHMPILSVIFCICTILASFGVGCTTQANAIGDSVSSLSNSTINTSVTGIVISLLCGFVIIGGFNSISSICIKLVPIMTIFYLTGCIYLLVCNFSYIPDSISLILKSAFSNSAIFGGIVSYNIKQAMRFGVARGLFTNEAGLGSTPIAACENLKHSEKTGSLVSMTAIFWDTVIMCTITGLVIISTILKNNIDISMYKNTELVNVSFKYMPYIGSSFISISLIAFAFATLIGWSFFGEKAFCYLFGIKHLELYKISYLVMIFIGAIMPLDAVWQMCDLFNALMALPNIISLILLRNVIKY